MDDSLPEPFNRAVTITRAARYFPIDNQRLSYVCFSLLDEAGVEHPFKVPARVFRGFASEIADISNRLHGDQAKEGKPLPPIHFETRQILIAATGGNVFEGNVFLQFFTAGGTILETIIGPDLAARIRASLDSSLNALPNAPKYRNLEDSGLVIPGGDVATPQFVTYFGQKYDARVLMALGLLIVRANLLEQRLVMLLSYFTDMKDEQARALFYSVQNTRGRLDLVTAAGKTSNLSEKDEKMLNDIISQARSAFDQRNNLIHAAWSIRRGKMKATVVGIRGKDDRNIPATPDTIERLAYDLRHTASMANYFLSRLIRADIAKKVAARPSENRGGT